MSSTDERPRFLSEADCHVVAGQLTRAARGGGYTVVSIQSRWTGNVRWARNQVSTSGEVLDHTISIGRTVNGSGNRMVWVNDIDDATLVAAVRRAERLAAMGLEQPQSDLVDSLPLEPSLAPTLFSDTTYDLDAGRRSEAARTLAQSAVDAGMYSAGYVEVAAQSQALIDTLGRSRYFQHTAAQYSVTVRDPKGVGSGWAGVDWYDWRKIDGVALSKLALQKCLDSRNPVALEPGRYTTILEPQAVCDFVSRLVLAMGERVYNEGQSEPGPFTKSQDPVTALATTKLGDQIFDERISITTDPMDPELGFPPFNVGYAIDGQGDPFTNTVYHPATWVEHGVLRNLGYYRDYAIDMLGQPNGLPLEGAFRMSGGTTSLEEMITTTKRGLLVTRFDRLQLLNMRSQLYTGYTRDGLWLIENGKISKPVKNFAFTESPLFALNKVEQIGTVQRVFHPGASYAPIPAPVIVPALKIRDFSFTALIDAV